MQVRFATPTTAAVLAAAALAGAGVAASSAAPASAAPAQGSLGSLGSLQAASTSTGSTVTVHIVNETDDTMYYDGGGVQDGRFTDAPWNQIRPHSVEDITAVAPDPHGLAVTLDYHLSNGVSYRNVTLHANDYQGNVNTVGTDAHVSVSTHSQIHGAFPNPDFDFSVAEAR